jgi:uncharacterized membrane protein YfcA
MAEARRDTARRKNDASGAAAAGAVRGRRIWRLFWRGQAANMDVHEASGLRILCGTLTNSVAIVLFAVRGIIVWRLGLPMMLACIAGGYWGAMLVKRLEAEKARKTILVYAWVITVWLFIRSIPVS